MARDTRLPLSGTSTHLSVSPKKLTLNNAPVVSGSNTATQNISYDGSTAYTIDLSKISAAYASAWSSAKGGISQPIYFDSNGAAQIATDVFAKSVGGTVTAETTFNAIVHLLSTTIAGSVSASSLTVSGATSLVNNTNTSNVYPHANETYNIGSSALKYNQMYAKEFHGALKGAADYAAKSSTASIGSGTKPIYIDSNGNWTASTSNVGNTNKPVYLKAGVITVVSGTYGGPPSGTTNQFKLMYINSGAFTNCSTTVGSASKPAYLDGGVLKQITSLDDSIVAGKASKWSGGAKGSATRAIYLDSNGTPQETDAMFLLAGDNIITGVNTFNGNATFNSSVDIDSLAAGSLIVTGNTTLVNNTSTGNIAPAANTTYSIGTNALKYNEIYATYFRGTADIAVKLSSSYGSTSLPIYIQSSGVPASITSLDMGSGAIKTTGTATLTTASIGTLTASTSLNYSGIATASENADHYIWFAKTGAVGTPKYNTGFKYNPSTRTVTATKFSGTLDGSATSAGKLSSQVTISLSGAVSGSVNTDFSSNPTITTSYAGTVPVNKGGTNITSYTKGDMLYANNNSTPALAKLAAPTTANAILVGTSNTTTKAPAWRTNVTVSTSAMSLSNTSLSVGSTADTSSKDYASAALVVAGGASISKTVAAKKYMVDDHVTLQYDSATESLNFIFA